MMHFVHAIFYRTVSADNVEVCEKVFSVQEEDDEKLDSAADAVIKNFLASETENTDWIFAGVRKIIRMADSQIDLPAELTGIQVTESIFEVKTMKEVENLARGEMVELTHKN